MQRAGGAARVTGLRTGLEPGPIVIMMPNSIEMDVALMAVMSVGAQVAPVNPFLTVAEIGKVLDGFGAQAIVCDQSTRDKANAVAEKIGVAHVVTVGDGGESLSQWTNRTRRLDARPAKMPKADDLALIDFHRRHHRHSQGRRPYASRPACGA